MSGKQGDFTFGWEVNAFTESKHVVISENSLLFITLLCCSLILQYQVGNVWKFKFLPEALATMLFTMIIGGIIRIFVENHGNFSPMIIGFSSEIFYFILLPPIIFNSGYYLRRRLLYGNLGAVINLAFIGTCISITITAIGIQYIILTLQHNNNNSTTATTNNIPNMKFMEIIAFSCVIASTDPISTLAIFSRLKVDPTLYYAILGESVLNDAVAITAFRISSRYIQYTTITYIDSFICLINFFVLVIY